MTYLLLCHLQFCCFLHHYSSYIIHVMTLSESNRCWMSKQTLVIFTGSKRCPLIVTHSCRTLQRYCLLKLDLTCFINLLQTIYKNIYPLLFLPTESERKWMNEWTDVSQMENRTMLGSKKMYALQVYCRILMLVSPPKL